MKKILCLALSAIALVSCEFVTQREKELTAKNETLATALADKNAALDQALQAIADIQEDFRAINEAEGRVSIQAQGGEGITDAERMKEDILFIQQKMEDSRKQIETLEKKLKASGAESANLRKVLANPAKYAPSGVYIMRIHGTFVNFLDLSPAIQEDIILRLDPNSTAC